MVVVIVDEEIVVGDCGGLWLWLWGEGYWDGDDFFFGEYCVEGFGFVVLDCDDYVGVG